MEKIHLTLHKNYVSDWDDTYAIREIIQNVKDNSSNEIIGVEKGVAYIGNEEGFLDKSTLLLGNSSKKDNKNIGKFGEGYKLALLVLTRLNKKVSIYQKGEKWTSSFEEHPILKEEVLCITINKSSKIENGIIFEIEGITDIEDVLFSVLLDKEKSSILFENDIGRVVENDNKGKGNIYINGLFITRIKGLEYCYDFNPNNLNIGRDRNIISDFDVCYKTSKMWSKIQDNKLVKNIKENILDLKYLEHHVYNIKSDIRETLALEYKDYIPVSSNQEIEDYVERYETKNMNFKIVNPAVKYLIPKPKMKERIYFSMGSFYSKYKKYFTKQMKKDWERLS